MKSLSGVGLGLSLVFGCLLTALLAELYYLLWWKKRVITKTNNDENGNHIPPQRSKFFNILFGCWRKKPTSCMRSTAQELCSSTILVHEPQSSSSNSNNNFLWLNNNKPFGEDNFPRFLFTITEETREDLESEDGIVRNRKNSTSKSNLSDLLQILETPFLTPVGSPPYFTPPLTPPISHNPKSFFELESDFEFNRLKSSPPPKFKFLRDAEEKLVQRKKIIEDVENGEPKNEENGPFITIIVAKSSNQEEEEDEDGVCVHNQL